MDNFPLRGRSRLRVECSKKAALSVRRRNGAASPMRPMPMEIHSTFRCRQGERNSSACVNRGELCHCEFFVRFAGVKALYETGAASALQPEIEGWCAIEVSNLSQCSKTKGKSQGDAQRDAQNPVASSHDLAFVVTAWAKLSPALKTAILAIAGSVADSSATSTNGNGGAA